MGERERGERAPGERRVVLGLGNVLNRDEGVGVHALRALETQVGTRPDVELVDGGVLGLNLLPLVESTTHLLVLDAIDAGWRPGTVVELGRNEITMARAVKLSEHQVTFQEVLGLAGARGRLPEFLCLLGAQPADVGVGLELSPALVRAIPRVVRRAIHVLDFWDGKVPIGGGG